MGTTPVLHIHDTGGQIDGFMMAHMFLVTRGADDVIVHIDREGGSVDIFRVTREGTRDHVVAGTGQCGCP